jgi:hypothetical protein
MCFLAHFCVFCTFLSKSTWPEKDAKSFSTFGTFVTFGLIKDQKAAKRRLVKFLIGGDAHYTLHTSIPTAPQYIQA